MLWTRHRNKLTLDYTLKGQDKVPFFFVLPAYGIMQLKQLIFQDNNPIKPLNTTEFNIEENFPILRAAFFIYFDLP